MNSAKQVSVNISFNYGQLKISRTLINNRSWTKERREKEISKVIYHRTVSFIKALNPTNVIIINF